MKEIILASSSPNRKDLMNRLLVKYKAMSPDIDESPLPGEHPEALALRLSLEKAQKIADLHPHAVVIGSDQVCAAGSIAKAIQVAPRRNEAERAECTDSYMSTRGELQQRRSLNGEGYIIINKPETHDKALAQWQDHLSGQTVIFYTGVAVCSQGRCQTAMVPTELKFKALPVSVYEAYLAKDQPYGCCAGFKIESLGIALVEWVKSEDPTALIGLPLIKTIDLLEAIGVSV